MTAGTPAAGEGDTRRPRIDDGVLLIDGEPRLLIAGEYPYYRDEPAAWESKLHALRRAGIEVVTFYVPWRHHEIDDDGGRSLRFDGNGNRDLVGFIELIRRLGLHALPKPGPYVHAELPFGGLPDRVSPSRDRRREAARSAAGEPLRAEGLVLPAADSPGFRADARLWLAAVGDVLRPLQHPDGPVVAVQVGNEGAYGEAALEVDADDYSPSAAAAFQAFAPGCEPPRAWDAPRTLGDLRPYLLWGDWLGDAIAGRLAWFAASLDLEVPMLANLPPPARAERHRSRPGGRYDAWLVRNRPWRRPGVHYATTSWVGNAILDDEALVSHVLAAAVRRGPNLEENWSLSWADPLAAHANVPIFHALLGLACGATGATVYTACATDSWGPHLELARPLDPPYGEAAPVTVDAGAGPSFEPLRVLSHFLSGAGPDIARARPQPGITWCSYLPYAALGAWDPRPGVVEGYELPAPSTTLAWLLAHCLDRTLPVALADVEAELPAGPLVLVGGPFMAGEVQARLARRLEAERAPLLLLGEVPRLDECFEPSTTLADALERTPHGQVSLGAPRDRRELLAIVDSWLARVPGLAARPADRSHLELRLVGPRDSTFVFLLSRSSETVRVRTEVGALELAVRLAPYASSVVQVRDGRLTSCYVKGISEQAATGVPVEVRLGPQEIASTHACDLSARRGDEAWEVVASGGPANTVAVSRA